MRTRFQGRRCWWDNFERRSVWEMELTPAERLEILEERRMEREGAWDVDTDYGTCDSDEVESWVPLSTSSSECFDACESDVLPDTLSGTESDEPESEPTDDEGATGASTSQGSTSPFGT